MHPRLGGYGCLGIFFPLNPFTVSFQIVVDMREFNSELPTVLYKKGYDVVAATLEVC